MALTPELQGLARQTAALNMSVEFQTAVARFEMDIYFDHLVETRDFLQGQVQSVLGKEQSAGRLLGKEKLDGWIVCGSGIASLPNAEGVRIIKEIPVEEIPHWFVPQAPGHGKSVIIAEIAGQLVGIQTGRAHIYDTDGSPRQLRMITAPLRVARGLGIDWLITTNAAGAYDNGIIKKGDVVADIDYVNQFAVNPLLGPNDSRLGPRFPGKGEVADPYLFERLHNIIPQGNLHLGIYTLSSNSPFYEGIGDVVQGIYDRLLEQNPYLAQLYGMSFALEAMVMQHFNDKPENPQFGFDRKVRWVGLTAATNVVPPINVPTAEQLLVGAVSIANPTNEEEVLAGGKIAEDTLIPAVVQLCGSISANPLPPIYPAN